MDIRKLLENTSFFNGLDAPALDTLAAICYPRPLRRREPLFREGERAQAMYLVLSGAVRLFRTAPDGKETVIKVVGPGEAFAEVVLFEEACYPVTAEAVSDSSVISLPIRQVRCLLEEEGFRNAFITMLMRKQRYLVSRIDALVSQDVEERFVGFLRERFGERGDWMPGLSKKDVAAAIGATPETFSRLLRRLGRQGRLTWERGRIRARPAFWNKPRAGVPAR